MIVTIHQPAYLPWLGYFEKINNADLFIFLDDVQFQKNSFQNRNKIRTKSKPIWLTVPVKTKGLLFKNNIKNIEIDNSINWQRKHINSIKMNYSKAPFFDFFFQKIERFYLTEYLRLADLCFEMTEEFNKLLKISTPLVKSSELSVHGSKSELILNLCKKVGATSYLSGANGKNYLDIEKFVSSGVNVEFQDFLQPNYQQCYVGFEPFMSVIDALFCAGTDIMKKTDN